MITHRCLNGAEGFFRTRAESLGIGGNTGSIAKQSCFEVKTQTEPSAERGALQGQREMRTLPKGKYKK